MFRCHLQSRHVDLEQDAWYGRFGSVVAVIVSFWHFEESRALS